MISLTEDRVKIDINRPRQASITLINYQQALIHSLSGQELTEDDRYFLADLLKEMNLNQTQMRLIEEKEVA
jgi:hypothetical protein